MSQKKPAKHYVNLSKKKSRMTAFALVLGLVALGAVLWSPKWPTGFEPGKRSSAHAAIESCDACHVAMHHMPGALLGLASQDKHRTTTQKCLVCHQMGEQSLSPHGLSPARLNKLTQKASKNKVGANPWWHQPKVFHGIHGGKVKLSCATCHKEHKGNQQLLSWQFVNEQCQVCHKRAFKNFKEGHPEFSNRPDPARHPLVFDHVTHLNKYFKEAKHQKNAPKNCEGCHKQDASSEAMVMKPYEKTCAACHDAQIKGEGQASDKGFKVLTLPAIDVAGWPTTSDEQITPFMAVLFPQQLALWLKPMEAIYLDDLSGATADKKFSALQFAKSYKAWLNQLRHQGNQLFYAKSPLKQSVEAIPEALLDDLWQVWFEGKAIQRKKTKTPEEWAAHGGWYMDGFGLYYRPRHHADGFVVGWVNAIRAQGSLAQKALWELLSHDKSPGACATCHGPNLTWRGYRRGAEKQVFTHFAHGPHLKLQPEKRCASCHTLATTGEKTPEKSPDFTALKRSECVVCHQATKVRSNCLVCHRYHVTKPDGQLALSPQNPLAHLPQILGYTMAHYGTPS